MVTCRSESYRVSHGLHVVQILAGSRFVVWYSSAAVDPTHLLKGRFLAPNQLAATIIGSVELSDAADADDTAE